MTRRFLFLCPDRRSASGGIAVIYDAVVTLRRAGHEAAIVHNAPGAGYPDYDDVPPLFHTYACRRVQMRHYGMGRTRLRHEMSLIRDRMRGGALPALDLRRDDVIVAPEFMMAEAMEAFPDPDLGVRVQNPFCFMEAHLRGLERGLDIRDRAAWLIGIADICMRQFDLLDLKRVFYMPVSMKPEEFPFRADKRKLITYMPRKRPVEARLIDRLLRDRGRVAGYEILALDGIPRAEVSRKLQESLVFISLLKAEALGFPAAEAMAAGCVTIGFTGLGGDEYFDAASGVPVPEGDLAGLIHAVEASVAEYEADPARLDALRRHASGMINDRYSSARFETALLRIWSEIDSGARSG
jgi:hypothetical protein